MKHTQLPLLLHLPLSIAAVVALASSGVAQELAVSDAKPALGDDAVVSASGNQRTPSIAAGGAGYLVAWSDERSNPFLSTIEQTGRDLYALRLDANGDPLDAAPIALSESFGNQENPRVSWNGTSWLVAWEDQIPTQTFYHVEVRGVRVAPDGTVLDATPLLIADLGQFADADLHGMTSNGSDWMVVTQSPSGGGLQAFLVSPAGDVTGPVVVAPNTFFLYFDVEVASAQGEYLLTYKASSQYLAQRLQADLTPIGSTFVVPGDLGLASNGSQYFLVWSTGALLGSRMTVDGTLLNPEGVVIASPSGLNTSNVHVVWDGTSWWTTWRKSAVGVALARIAANGEVLDPGGFALDTNLASSLLNHGTAANPTGGVQVAWQDNRTAELSPDDVYTAPVSALAVPGPETAISLGEPSHVDVDLTEGPNGFLLVYRSDASGQSRILAERLDEFGNSLDPTPVEVATGTNTTLGFPDAAWNGEHYLVVWPGGGDVVARRFAPDLTPVDAQPFFVMNGYSSDVASLGDDFLVVATYQTFSIQFIFPFAARVDGPTGTVLDPTPIALGQSFAQAPSVTTLGNRWLATWQRNFSHDDVQAVIKAAFVDVDGTTPGEFDVGGISFVGGTPDVATSDGTAFFAWRKNSLANANNDVVGVTMQADGTFGSIVTLSADPGRQLAPTVAWTGTEFVAVWEDMRNQLSFFDERTDLYGARVDEAGNLLESGVAILDRDMPATDPELAALGDRLVLAAAVFESAPTAAYRAESFHLGPWAGLGNALAGTYGEPVLDGDGQLVPGSTVEWVLSRALPGTFGAHLLGASRIDLPFLGGVLVPLPTVSLPFTVDGQGRAALDLSIFSPLPSGATIYVQSLLFDPGAVQSFALSGAIASQVP